MNFVCACIVFLLQLASMCMNREEIIELYSNQAGGLRAKGRYKDAERLADCSFEVFLWLLHKIIFVLLFDVRRSQH